MSAGRLYALCFGLGLCGSLAWACGVSCDCGPVAERPAQLPVLNRGLAEWRGEGVPAPPPLVGGRVDVRPSEVVVTYSSGLGDYTVTYAVQEPLWRRCGTRARKESASRSLLRSACTSGCSLR